MSGRQEQLSWTGLINLVIVWIIWGSTYLAIRVAVREGSGFPPFYMAASRILFSGSVLLLIGAAVRHRLWPHRREWLILAASGILLWNGGNGLVTWAEQRAHSGYAALLVGSTPIFATILEALVDRRRPTLAMAFSILTGFAGLAVLTWPTIHLTGAVDWWSTLALVGATISWSIGSMIQQRNPNQLSPLVSSAWQQLLGCAGFGLLILLSGEPAPHPTRAAWIAWAYLATFGSLLGFTAYVTALRKLPIPVVMTYAYVNPVIAVALGRFLLNEEITLWTLAGMALILAGVAGVFHDRFAKR